LGGAVIHLLDTHICIYIINKRPPQVLARFDGLRYGAVGVSSITGAELSSGVAKSGSARNRDALDMLIAAHALALEATLITNHLAEFARVPGLVCENWV
jgi:tRNA(fMet)-specific endonuclease VapC